MRFAAVTVCVGLAGALLAANLPSTGPAEAGSLVEAMRPSADITGSVSAAGTLAPTAAVRLIDLRNGASCKIAGPAEAEDGFQRMLTGPDCAASPELSRAAFWRTTEEGTLVVADRGGETVLEFVPGDGVLFESVYPANALVTIVPARS